MTSLILEPDRLMNHSDLDNRRLKGKETETLDFLDLWIIARYFLSSASKEDHLWQEDTQIEKIIPLLDRKENIIAYYVRLSDDLYVIINNRRNNPVALEYGKDQNRLLDGDLIAFPHSSGTPPIKHSALQSNIPEGNYYYNKHPHIRNQILDDVIAGIRAELLALSSSAYYPISLFRNKSYPFINQNKMPSPAYDADEIAGLAQMSWAITKSYNDIAKNHCAAVLVTNLALYFSSQGYHDLKSAADFETVHAMVGNGPKLFLAPKAKKVFAKQGCPLNYTGLGTFAGLKGSIAQNRPLGILLANGLFDWHWVMAVGYRQYHCGESYIRIVDGWNNSSNRYYNTRLVPLWWSATSYWIDELHNPSSCSETAPDNML